MDIFRIAFIGHRYIEGQYHLEDRIEDIIREKLHTKEYQSMLQKHEEQKALTEKVEKLQKENVFLKILSGIALGIGCIALIIALI